MPSILTTETRQVMPPTVKRPGLRTGVDRSSPTDGSLKARRFQGTDAGAWLRALDPKKRATLKDLHETRPAWNFVAAFFPAMWAAAVVSIAIWPYWPVRVAGYVIAGAAIHAMAVLTHEASHYSMFRSHFLDRWVGFLMGAPVFLSHTAYRVLHGDHHRFTRDEGDPDEFLNVSKNKVLVTVLFYSWLVIGTPVYLIHVTATAMIRGTWRDRIDVIVEYVLLIAMFVGAFLLARHYGRLDLILHGWALPMVVGMVFGNVRSWAEHAMTKPGDPLTRTRTVTSTRLVSFLMCNLNYHLEHHLCPGIPWYNLPKMHALLKEEYEKAGSFIYRSYWRFLWDAARTGVYGTTPAMGF